MDPNRPPKSALRPAQESTLRLGLESVKIIITIIITRTCLVDREAHAGPGTLWVSSGMFSWTRDWQ